ncbi:MAG: DUF2284 domain-containing protein [Thermoplasmata archaeon]|nr:DUF2284 domain-containing protein [Thermoplasmata archaeon]
MTSEEQKLAQIVAAVMSLGASEAKIIDAKDIVVDKRVRLKCMIPICSDYNRHMMCPPNLMPVEEFADIVGLYKMALIVQIEADVDSSDKSSASLSKELCSRLEKSTNTNEWEEKLHRLINKVEAHAFKEGFYLAAGLIGGSCSLCQECVDPRSGNPCRHPFEARPSMEAMGIDVVRTCKNVGLPLHLSSDMRIRWTGLVLLH